MAVFADVVPGDLHTPGLVKARRPVVELAGLGQVGDHALDEDVADHALLADDGGLAEEVLLELRREVCEVGVAHGIRPRLRIISGSLVRKSDAACRSSV